MKYLPNILRYPQSIVGSVVKTKLGHLPFFFLTASFSLITSFFKRFCHSRFCLDAMSKIYHDNTEKWNAVPGSWRSHVGPEKDQMVPHFLQQVKIIHAGRGHLSEHSKRKLLTQEVPTQKKQVL